jgi:hypothetical protein
VSVDAGGVAKVVAAVATLVAAVGGLLVAVRSGGDAPYAPSVIVIRGSVLPEDDLTDSERDREWLSDLGVPGE